MKKPANKPGRILAAVGGALIVLVLLLAADGIGGDPLSRAWSRHAATAFAQKLYPGQTFTVTNSYYSGWFRYVNEVQSGQSTDTRFEVLTRFWFLTSDVGRDGVAVHEFTVEERRNTRARLEYEAKQRFEAIAAVQQGGWYADSFWMLLCSPPQQTADGLRCSVAELPEGKDRLPLDAPLTADLLQQLDALLQVFYIWPGEELPTEAEQAEVLRTVKGLAETEGLPARYYRLVFVAPVNEIGMHDILLQMPDTPAEEID